MKAMIFAAGLGTRLRPFTLRHPKALVPVDGVPMLQRVIERVASAGITDIVVNIHHFGQQIVDFLQANRNFGLNIAVSDETDQLLDTGGGLLKALTLLGENEPVLIHNADILTDLPLSLMIDFHKATKADATLLCSQRSSSRQLWFKGYNNRLVGWENCKTGETRPAGFAPGTADEASPFDGVHIVNPALLPLLRQYHEELADHKRTPGAIVPFSIIPFYLSAAAESNIVRFMLPTDYQWFDVGSADKLEIARQAFPSLRL